MKKAILFIGSNNATHKLETSKACDIISKYHDGFTATEVVGYWMGARERTLRVEIATEQEEERLIDLCEELRDELEQQAVMLEIAEANINFV